MGARVSLQRAYSLSEMSNLAYKERAEVESVMKNQLGYYHFSWFEVSTVLSTVLSRLFSVQ